MNRSTQPPIKQLEQISLQLPERFTLPNGVPFTLINAAQEDVVRIDILFRGGRWRQSQKLQALFASRMLREGSVRYTSKEISEKLDYYGAWLELSSSSDYDFVTFYSLNKYFDLVLEVIESIIKEPLFPEKELEVVVNSNLQHFVINKEKVDYQSQRNMLKALFGENHPCGLMIDENDFKAITAQGLKDYFGNYYHSNNCAIFASGKVTQAMINRLVAVFGEEPFGENLPSTELPFFDINPTSEKQLFIEHPESLQSSVKIGMHVMERTHPDFFKFRVLTTLLGGYFGSRLMTNIREDKGYTYGISAGLINYPHGTALMIGAETDHSYVQPLIKEVHHEIDRLKSELVGEDELSMVKNYMVGEMCRSYESAFSLSDAWIYTYTNQLSDDYYDQSLSQILTTTPQDLKRLAEQFMCKDYLKEVIAGKK